MGENCHFSVEGGTLPGRWGTGVREDASKCTSRGRWEGQPLQSPGVSQRRPRGRKVCVCGLLPEFLFPDHMALLTPRNATDLLPDPLPLPEEGPMTESQPLGTSSGRSRKGHIVAWDLSPALPQPALSPAAQGGTAGHLGRPTATLCGHEPRGVIPRASSGCGLARGGVEEGSRGGRDETIPLAHHAQQC